MINLKNITNEVRYNCDLSDSQFAGYYSICNLALRLRDLYKWDKRLEPWVEHDSSNVLEWIGNKEEEWEELQSKDYHKIPVGSRNYDPFDATGINTTLEPHNLFYGAGYAGSLKPAFFLANLEEKKQIEGQTLYVVNRELARDLLTIPALSQDNCIIFRKECAKFFLWDKIFFISKSGKSALRFALNQYGLEEGDYKGVQQNIDTILLNEKEIFIYHELGEILDDTIDRSIWREIIALFPMTLVEFLSRTIKDVIADTNAYGPLQYIVKERKTSSLGFYMAFLEGLRKGLMPELTTAFHKFSKDQVWEPIEEAISLSYISAQKYAKALSMIYQEGKQRDDMNWVKDEVEKKFSFD